MNKPPPHSLYAKLTEDQRAQLHDWILTLGYPKTRERIALPPPEGFGIDTHLSCLHRFYQRYAAEQDAEQLSEAAHLSLPAPSEMFPLAQQAAHAGALRLTTAPQSSFAQLSQWVSAQEANQLKRDYIRIAEQNAAIAFKKATLAESRLELDHQKFRFNAARQALIHFAELAKIARNRNADDEAKIKAAADLLFRPQLATPTTQTPSEPLSQTLSDTNRAAQSAMPDPYQTEKIASTLIAQPDRKADASSSPSAPSAPSAVDPSLTPFTPVQNSAIRNPNSAIESPSAVKSFPNNQSSIIDHQFPSSSVPSVVNDSPPIEKSEIRNPQSEIESVPPGVKSHAIRRWRAHIPWPKGEPEPDGSWRDECPCGNPAPCSEHPGLKARVRYYKPQHPEYQFGLKQSNVPYYKPTAEEIGCTQAALDRSCDLFADNPRMKDPPHPAVDPFKKWIKRSES